MKLKPGVDISNLHPELVSILPLVEMTYNEVRLDNLMLTIEMTATSGHEESSKHGKKSRHYERNCESGHGEAIDFRMNDIHQTLATEICGMIAKVLRQYYPGKYKVFFEGCLTQNSHLHLQIRGKQ